MTVTAARPRVLIAGGGIAALELLLALRVHAGAQVEITLLSGRPQFAPPAMTVAEPFERGGAQTHEWAEIADRHDVRLVVDKLIAIDTAARTAFTHSGRRIPYDVLVLATGARRVAPFAGALTFGMSAAGPADLRALVTELRTAAQADLAFALPWPSIWSVPLYELALLTAHELCEHGSAARVRIVTPEAHALELLGPAARDAILPLFEALDIELIAGAQPRAVVAGGLLLDDGTVIAAEHVVALADVVARPVPGLPSDRAGFVPVDRYGLVAGEDAVYAAGEATSFPLRQGGIAAQQADVVAASIAARYAGGEAPAPFAPVLRGRLTTSGAPLYLQARPSGQSLASPRALWSPPEKVAGRYVAPYLATARPGRIAAAALGERVPAEAGAPGDEHDAVTLALTLATAESRCHNHARALQALDAAEALDAHGHDPAYAQLRVLLGEQVPAG
ncbi:MAG: sulfide:quinone oxidoreductase [Gaiellales bacterium]|nr:sulfide:quinone oxidoreductase [Gaiellales bacterium]